MNNPAHSLDTVNDPDWAHIMDLSRAMLHGAREEEWDRVCELQAERFQRIQRYFEAAPAAEILEGIRPDVGLLLEMDQEITDLGRKARHEMAEGIKALRNGRTARRAYGR